MNSPTQTHISQEMKVKSATRDSTDSTESQQSAKTQNNLFAMWLFTYFPPQLTNRTFGQWSFNCQVSWRAALFVLKSGRVSAERFGLLCFNSNKKLNAVHLHVFIGLQACSSLKRRNLNSSLLCVMAVHPSAHCSQRFHFLTWLSNTKRRGTIAGHVFTINLTVNTLGIKMTKCRFSDRWGIELNHRVIMDWRHSLRLHHLKKETTLKHEKSLKFLAWRLRKKNSLENLVMLPSTNAVVLVAGILPLCFLCFGLL